MNMTPTLAPLQQQKISQSQIQSLHILMMDNIELQEFLQKEYQENPLLEYTGQGRSPSYGAGNKVPSSSEYQEPRAKDSEYLLHYFLEQLNPSEYDSRQWKVLKFMILLLDEDGYFPYSPEDLFRMFRIPVSLAESCLQKLQSLEPCGVFQPDLKGSLLRQLAVCHKNTPQMTRFIQEHLEDAAAGNLHKISQALCVPYSTVKDFIRQIRELSPRPLPGISQDSDSYVIPDILADFSDEVWTLSINDNWMGAYSFNDYYLRMMQSASEPQLKAYFQEMYKRASFILQRIEQRRATVLSICRAILTRQEGYFAGQGELLPMTMSDIAKDLGIAVSTVSRGIKSKYLQSPRGTVELKTLFTSGISSGTDEEKISSSGVISILKRIIQSENKKKPYSDSRLAELLEEEGIRISRRTVAKYRLAENIPNASERKITP